MKKALPQIDKGLLYAALGLLAFGLVALSSASYVLSFERFGHNYYYLIRQILFGALPGLILMYLGSRYDYHKLQKFAPLFIFAGLVLLVAVLVPSIGFEVGGAKRWIDFGYFLFQPAEFVKLAAIIYLASWIDKRQHHIEDLYYGFLPSLGIVVLLAGLIMLQPDMGTMLVLISIAACMFFIGGVKLRYLGSVALAGLLALWIMIKAAPYRLQRILSYFNPEHDVQGASYQINQALLAIGSGGMWGSGFSQSRQKYNYLPEPIGDSIFAIISEELGFVRVAVLLILILFLSYRGYRIAMKAPDTFGKLLACGIVSWLAVQSLINIGGITATIPLTGVPLPFVSYGSSALVASLAALGILLNISRFTPHKSTN